MKQIIFIALFLPSILFGQSFTAPIVYRTGVPTAPPSATGSRYYQNLTTGFLYQWDQVSAWNKVADGIDVISGSAAPAYTPGIADSKFAINADNELYYYTGSSWVQINAGATYTAGTGIAISGGNEISNTGDLSSTNELNTSFSVSGSNLALTDPGGTINVPVTNIAPVQAVAAGTGISIIGTSTRTITNSAPDQTVSITGGGINAVTGTYPNFTVTGTEVDGSTTNEIQTLSFSNPNLSLSNGGGTVNLSGLGGVTGSGASGQVAYFVASSQVSSEADFTYNQSSGQFDIRNSSTKYLRFIPETGAIKSFVSGSHETDIILASSGIRCFSNGSTFEWAVQGGTPQFRGLNSANVGGVTFNPITFSSNMWPTSNKAYIFNTYKDDGSSVTAEKMAIYPGESGKIIINTGGGKTCIGGLTPLYTLHISGSFGTDATNTAAGTTGNRTINNASGTVNFAAGATTITVTNSLVTTASIIIPVIRTNDTTAVIKNVVPASGSFTITLNAAATAETSVGFFVIN
jgi:hypothetical protein